MSTSELGHESDVVRFNVEFPNISCCFSLSNARTSIYWFPQKYIAYLSYVICENHVFITYFSLTYHWYTILHWKCVNCTYIVITQGNNYYNYYFCSRKLASGVDFFTSVDLRWRYNNVYVFKCCFISTSAFFLSANLKK